MRWSDKPLAAKPAHWAQDDDVWPFSLDAIYEAIRSGALQAIKVGRHYAVTREALIVFFGDKPVTIEDDVPEATDSKPIADHVGTVPHILSVREGVFLD